MQDEVYPQDVSLLNVQRGAPATGRRCAWQHAQHVVAAAGVRQCMPGWRRLPGISGNSQVQRSGIKLPWVVARCEWSGERAFGRAVSVRQGVSQPGADSEAQLESVPYVLVYMTGEEFVALLERDGGSIEPLLARVAAAHPGHTFGLLLEGLQSYLKYTLSFSALCTGCKVSRAA